MATPTVAPGRADAGFTLIEVLLVLALMAIATTTVVAYVRPLPIERVVEANARELASRLRAARSEAIRRNQETVVEIDLRGRTVSRAGPGGVAALSQGVEIDATGALANVRADLGRVAFRFFPDGSSSGGNVRLRAGSATYQIVVDWISGSVRTQSGERP